MLLKDYACTNSGVDSECAKKLRDKNKDISDDQVNAYCKTSQSRTGFGVMCDLAGKFASGMMGFVGGMNPVHSVAQLSDAIHTLTDPEHSASKKCLAEEKLAKSSETIDKASILLADKLQSTISQLQALGELSAPPAADTKQ